MAALISKAPTQNSLAPVIQLDIYRWVDELGEVKRLVVAATGERVSGWKSIDGALIDFGGPRLELGIRWDEETRYVNSIRRAADGVGIEMVTRSINVGMPHARTIHPHEYLDFMLFKGRATIYWMRAYGRRVCRFAA